MSTYTDSNPDTSLHRPIDLRARIILLSIWVSLGLMTVINSIILREIVSERGNLTISPEGSLTLPESTREAIWLVVTIWAVAYISGFVVGFLTELPLRTRIGNSVFAYLVAILLHIMFLGVFPGTPINSYDVLRNIISLQPLPVYFIFLVMVLLLGPIVTGLATYTGSLIATEFPATRISERIQVEPAAVIFSALMPVFMIFCILSIVNLRDYEAVQETTEDYQRIVSTVNREITFAQRETEPVIVFLHINTIIHPRVLMVVAVLIGMTVGVKRTFDNPMQATLSVLAGFGTAMLMLFVLIDIFEPEVTPNVSYSDVYDDTLGTLQAPEVVPFLIFWFFPPIVAATVTFALQRTMASLSSNAQSVTLPE